MCHRMKCNVKCTLFMLVYKCCEVISQRFNFIKYYKMYITL